MMKTLAFLAICIVASGMTHAQEDSTSAKPALPAKSVGRYELKQRSSFTVQDGTRSPFLPVGWVKPAPGQTNVVVQSGPRITEGQFRVTSILVGSPSLAVINGRSYSEGEPIRMGRGATLKPKVYRISDGKVVIQVDSEFITVPLHVPKLNDPKSDEILNSERE